MKDRKNPKVCKLLDPNYKWKECKGSTPLLERIVLTPTVIIMWVIGVVVVFGGLFAISYAFIGGNKKPPVEPDIFKRNREISQEIEDKEDIWTGPRGGHFRHTQDGRKVYV